MFLLAALADVQEDEDDDNDCHYAYADGKNHRHVNTSFFFLFLNSFCRRRNGLYHWWLWLRLRIRHNRVWFLYAADGRAGWVHRNNSQLHDTIIVFDAMYSDPLLGWTELVPFGHFGLPWYFVTVFKDS